MVVSAFFRSFFSLLLVAIAASEWAVIAHVMTRLGATLPAGSFPAGLGLFFVGNRVLVQRMRAPRSPRGRRLLRYYAAAAFTAVFCGVYLALVEAVRGAVWLGAWPIGIVWARGMPLGANPLVSQAFVGAVDVGLVGIVGVFVFGFTVGRRALSVTRFGVDIVGLPAAFDGLRVVHLSDLHIGAHLDLDELDAHVTRVNALAPDLVCITGDLVDRADTCASAFPRLAALRARYGVIVTLGNHDIGAGADEVVRRLREDTDFTVLRDACVDLEADGVRLRIVGLDDLGRDWARGVEEHPALPPLVAGIAAGAPFVVLSHRPDCFPQAAALGAGLVLSGHTHGGQLGLPSWRGGRPRNLAEFITRFDRGRYTIGAATLYVNRGLGFTGQPIRLFTPREIAVLELRAVA